MIRRTFRSVVAACTVVLFACGDAGTLTDLPSYDRRVTDPPKDFATLVPGQLQLPAGALPYAQKVIGAEGGELILHGLARDGQPTFHRLVVPAGAVQSPALFIIQLASSTEIDVDLFAYRMAANGRQENVGEAGFLKPVFLELSYAWAKSPVDPAALEIVYVVGNRVKEHMPTRANPIARSVVGQLRHFSRYAVAAD